MRPKPNCKRWSPSSKSLSASPLLAPASPRGALGGPAWNRQNTLARAIAGEAEVPFFTLSASEFVEMFVGVGAAAFAISSVRPKPRRPASYIDEIDAVGRQRGAGIGGGNDEREQTLNQLLTEMDGFEENSGIIMLAATNRADVLDTALLRPGRFDRQILVELPDRRGREAILGVHARSRPLSDEVSMELWATADARVFRSRSRQLDQ